MELDRKTCGERRERQLAGISGLPWSTLDRFGRGTNARERPLHQKNVAESRAIVGGPAT